MAFAVNGRPAPLHRRRGAHGAGGNPNRRCGPAGRCCCSARALQLDRPTVRRAVAGSPKIAAEIHHRSLGTGGQQCSHREVSCLTLADSTKIQFDAGWNRNRARRPMDDDISGRRSRSTPALDQRGEIDERAVVAGDPQTGANRRVESTRSLMPRVDGPIEEVDGRGIDHDGSIGIGVDSADVGGVDETAPASFQTAYEAPSHSCQVEGSVGSFDQHDDVDIGAHGGERR